MGTDDARATAVSLKMKPGCVKVRRTGPQEHGQAGRGEGEQELTIEGRYDGPDRKAPGRSDAPHAMHSETTRFVSLFRIVGIYSILWPILVVAVSYLPYRWSGGSAVSVAVSFVIAAGLSLGVVLYVNARLIVPLRDLTFAIRDRRPEVLDRIARRSSLLELHRMIASFSWYFAAEEESKRRLAGALQEKTVVLEETRAGLRHTERLSSVGRMVAGIAHEINNPASYVAGNIVVLREYHKTLKHRLSVLDEVLDLAREGDCSKESLDKALDRLDDQDAEYDYRFVIDDLPTLVFAMSDGMERISNIIQSLRLFTHRELPRRELVNVRSALHNAIGVLRSRFREAIELEVSCDHPVGVLLGPGQMEQILLNLLSNALDAQPEGGGISVEIHDREDDAVIVVADRGPGIDREDLDHVFEPFFTTKPFRTNSGLGLAVVDEIVRRNGGFVSLESGIGEGTTVTIRFPAEPFPVEEIE
jgi:signal transduction histidine kinase